ncbi:aspartyl protease family protein 1-like [Syzygium oleosum]|uniref:aspartyl protease family protein 1-like n=1 Tax=Syzygium oleosum TaxID=219896 RepID=UPI0024B9193B|nr:aspartyl protease family protein 1-like [Syzygium oleosum]
MARAAGDRFSFTSPSSSCCCCSSSSYLADLVLCCAIAACLCAGGCDGAGTFGFDVHHRSSGTVKAMLAAAGEDGLPEAGSLGYYAAMAHRDRLAHGRRLAASAAEVDRVPITFDGGNDTYRIKWLGYLHYADVSVGTPSLSFLVALDTGSDLFWIPCDCSINCVHGLKLSNGQEIDFNIYSPDASSSSTLVPCSGGLCRQQFRCSATHNQCPYQVVYVSNGTSSTGILVEDVLHMTSDDNRSKVVTAQITFGCGLIQTGSFLEGGAPNGLFGLGMNNISVPSILAKDGLAANSFSMCFGHDGIGRISFGDKGSSNQGETPFIVSQSHPAYNITVTQVIVGEEIHDLEFSAIFDSGTSFTYLNDPAYTLISKAFDSSVQEKRHSSDPTIPFEYCYDPRTNQSLSHTPVLNLTMKGGDSFYVTEPVELISVLGGHVYCLAVVKSGNLNIIGQNFMTGYRVVFDRERMVLGWKPSNCYDVNDTSMLPVNPKNTSAIPPSVAFNPEATKSSGDNNRDSAVSPPMLSYSWHLRPFTCLLITLVYPFLAIF